MCTQQANAELPTLHGGLCLPAFLPDATRGVVRCLDSSDLRGCGVQGFVVSTFDHRPGGDVLSAAGGIHAFAGWSGPVLSDSGGFQIYSLLRSSPHLGSITKKGFYYRLQRDEGKKLLTPEKSIRKQLAMGADIVVCLDQCTHPDAGADEQRAAVERTVAWARRCREEFDRLSAGKADRPRLFAVIQGGADAALRRECAARLLEIGFDGYGFGGWPVDEAGRLEEMVPLVAELVPAGLPKWAFGIGKPEHVVSCAGLGYDLFDCALPTRDARHRRLYVFRAAPAAASLAGEFYEHLYIQDDKYIRDAAPVEASCDCLCCRQYSRAYLRHLFRIGDALAARLATIHNLRFYTRLMPRLRRRGAER